MKENVKVTHANVIFFVFTVLFILFQIILGIISAGMSALYGSSYAENFFNDNVHTFMLISEYGIILAPVLAYALFSKLDFKKVFRLNNPGIVPVIMLIPISVFSYICFLSINMASFFVMQFFVNIPESVIPVPQDLPQLVKGIFIIALTPAICEEALHRGIMLKAYENRGTLKALVISAFFFGIFHFELMNLFGTIFMGIVIGYTVIRTNSIFAGIIVHFLNNTIAEFHSYLGRNIPETIEGTFSVGYGELMFILATGMVSFIILSVLMRAFKHFTRDRVIIRQPISSVKEDAISVFTHWPVIAVISIYIIQAAFFLILYAK